MGIKVYLKKILPAAVWGILQKINCICRALVLHIKSIWLFIKCFKYKPQNYLSIVAIIKNEGPYIAEWIEYHLLVGVTKFYIYDNESEDNLKEILEPYIKDGIVEYKYCPGRVKQLFAYNDILEKARKETYWLALIDCDEFLVPVSMESITSLLKEFEGYGGLGVNWMTYGSGGHQSKQEGLVIERFKDHSEETFDFNRHIKTVANLRYTLSIPHVHYAEYITGKFCINTDKEIIIGPFSYGVFDKLRINHYFIKSYEEFLQKRERGRADFNVIRPMQDFYDNDRNEEKDDPIMDKYIPVIYKNMKERYNRKEKKLSSNPLNNLVDNRQNTANPDN